MAGVARRRSPPVPQRVFSRSPSATRSTASSWAATTRRNRPRSTTPPSPATAVSPGRWSRDSRGSAPSPPTCRARRRHRCSRLVRPARTTRWTMAAAGSRWRAPGSTPSALRDAARAAGAPAKTGESRASTAHQSYTKATKENTKGTKQTGKTRFIMSNENAFEMAAAAIRFGVGVTREVGFDLADLGIRAVLVLTDPS